MLNKHERVLLRGSNLWYLAEGMLGPLFAVFAERVGGDVLEISWAWATYLIVAGVLVVLVGRFSDGPRRKERLMVLGYALNTVFTFSYLFVSTPMHLFLVQIGFGISAALSFPTWEALYAKYEDKNHDGESWGLADGQARIITGIAMLIGGFIVSRFSFDALFIVMGTLMGVATLYQAKILRLKA